MALENFGLEENVDDGPSIDEKLAALDLEREELTREYERQMDELDKRERRMLGLRVDD